MNAAKTLKTYRHDELLNNILSIHTEPQPRRAPLRLPRMGLCAAPPSGLSARTYLRNPLRRVRSHRHPIASVATYPTSSCSAVILAWHCGGGSCGHT